MGFVASCTAAVSATINDPATLKTARLVGGLGLAWCLLEAISYVVIRPFFLQLLDGNPKLAGNAKKKNQTAIQMLPRVVCFTHNIIQIPLALFILLDPYYNKNTIWGRDDFSTLVMAISAGYFLYDSLECACRLKHEGVDFLMHGLFCLGVFTNLLHTGHMHFFGAGFLLWELSTPFIHFRWFLYKIGKDKTRLYSFNALAGFFIFFCCRILWGNYLSLRFWLESNKVLSEGAQLPMASIWFYRISTIAMNGLNAWWFSKMVQILVETMRAKAQSTRTAAA